MSAIRELFTDHRVGTLSGVAAAVLAVGAVALAPSGALAEKAGKHDHQTHAHGIKAVQAAQGPTNLPTNIWAISRGGQLYDKWWEVIESDAPKTTHPAYPKAGKKKGATTWRCKECHGWDYKGAAGAYGKGSHYSGIKGIRGAAGVDPARIRQILSDKNHRYTAKMLPSNALHKLALFVSFGQIDMDRYIDRATKKAHGDIRRGAQFFQTICANCHGYDGRKINFKDDKNPEYVGTVARNNPWEALHKIRFGQPGVGMVSLSVLEVQQQVDILAYSQTLPAK